MKKLTRYQSLLILALLSLLACKKQDDWLNHKSGKSQVVPETLADFQAIMDNTSEMNDRPFNNVGLTASDNLVIAEQELGNIYEFEKNMYLWDRNVWESGNSFEWNNSFRAIELINVVLEGVSKFPESTDQRKNVEGQAHFFRAIGMYTVAQVFCVGYNESSSNIDLGIPIRRTSDVNQIVHRRSSMKETFAFIIADLNEAISLLPDKQPYLQRPTSIAAKALLAKVYLYMGDYENARTYAGQVLNAYNQLLDFNNTLVIDYNSDNRFPIRGTGNPEIIFFAESRSFNNPSARPYPGNTASFIAPELYDSYNDNDLRKVIFYSIFDNLPRFAGTYNGNYGNFAGIATNEIYLIKSESEARLGNKDIAMSDLNTLLRKRYKAGTFVPVTAFGTEEALRIILQERRKELPFTGNLRWEDLKRLNRDPRFQKTLRRNVNGTTYTLPPNDKRYTFPIPSNEIQNSGIQQNDL